MSPCLPGAESNSIALHPSIEPLTDDIRHTKTKHLIYRGSSPTIRSRYTEENFDVKPCVFFERFLESNPDCPLQDYSECAPVKRSRERFMKSFMKCDVPPIKPTGVWEDIDLDAAFKLAVDYTYAQFSFLVSTKVASELDFNRSTSAGIPYNRMGYKNKGEVLDKLDLEQEMARRHIPIYAVNDKKEFLPVEDIVNLKVRTVFAPDVVFLAHQKLFTSDANDRMHDRWRDFPNFWSRYGMVKQYGGFNDLFSAHAERDIHITGDGSGWDRVLPLLPEVWSMRRFFFDDLPPEVDSLFDYVSSNTCYPLVGLPDGSVYQRITGNCSGSNSTTTDNCIAHTIITYFFILLLGFRAHGRFISRDEIHQHTTISLYGDDSFDSLDSHFFSIPGEDVETTKTEITRYYMYSYMSFGVVVKMAQFNYVVGKPDGLEFLGSTSLLSDGYYYPLPRLAKLCTSITQALSPKNHKQLVATIIALFDLTSPVPDPDCYKVSGYLSRFAAYVLQNNLVDDVSLTERDRIFYISKMDRTHSVALLTGHE